MCVVHLGGVGVEWLLWTGVEWEEWEVWEGGRWMGERSLRGGGGGGFLAATASEGLKDVKSKSRESRSKSGSGGGAGGFSRWTEIERINSMPY